MLGSRSENPLPRVWLGLLLVLAVVDFSLAAERTRLEPIEKLEEGLRSTDGSLYDYDEDTFSKKTSPLLSGEDSPFSSTEVAGKIDDGGREFTSEEEAPSVNGTDSSLNGIPKKTHERGTEQATVKSDLDLVQEDFTIREIDPVISTTRRTTTIEEFGKREKILEATEAIENFDVVSEAPDAGVTTTTKIQHRGLEKLLTTIANNGREFEGDEEEEDGNSEGRTISEFAEATTPSSKSLIANRGNVSHASHSSIERLDSDPEPNGRSTISLASDTAVNHRVDSENETGNFRRNGSDGSSSNEPKNQVEVFGDSGHPAVLRISQGADNETIVERTTTPYSVSSRAKGRTIEISGDNEVTTKSLGTFEPLTTPDPGSIRSFPKKSVSTEKPTELKPYPYSKSENRATTVGEDISTETPNRTELTTDEISAYENTIGRKKAEDKIVVTEPSVLVDNSIQQLKPVHGKRSGNFSRVNSTFGDPAAATVWSSSTTEDAGSRNNSENGNSESRTTATELGGRGQVDNNVPHGNWRNVSTSSERTPATILPEVTENNIETVIGRVNGTDASQTIASSEATERTKIISDASTATSDGAKIDRQESTAKLERLNVTDEGRTEGYSVTKESLSASTEESASDGTDNVKHWELDTTVSMVARASSTTEFAPESSSEVSTVTQKSNSEFNGITMKPTKGIEPAQPTTVEYEFVGLTEIENSTSSQSHVSGGSESVNAVTSSVEVSKTTEPEETTTEMNIVTESVTTLSRNTETPDPENPASTITINFEETTVGSSLPEMTTTPTSHTESEVTLPAETTYVYPDTTASSTPLATDKTPEARLDFTTSRASDDPREITTTTVMILTMPVTTQEATTVSSIEIIASSEGTTAAQNPVTATQGTTPLIEITSEAPEFPVSIDDVTLFVRIIIEGSWTKVCPLLDSLRMALAKLLTEGTNRSVSPRNIILHQTQCSVETPPSTGVTPVLLYVVNDNGDFDYAMTELLPNLYKQSPFGFPSTIHSVEKLIQDIEQNNNAIAVVAVSAVAFICLVLLAGLLFIMRKRQTRFNYGERCRPVSLDSYRVDSVSAYNSVRRKDLARSSKRSYGNPAFEDSSVTPTHPLNFAGLSSFCNDLNAITEEFSGIPQVSARIDELPAGAEAKNRYANVVPLPETRVPLQKINNEPLTEYINASYVRGPKNATKYYIACQAPIESTVADFWRMIWEQQSKVIIMLTDIIENGVEKCVDYIPPSEVTDCHRLYGDYQVTLKKHEAKEKYAISTLHLKNLENSTYREVSHIWYLWPTNGVPSDATGLIAILLEARALQRGAPGPIVVHCSPGTGRTGTLIALDLGIRQYEITRTVDVPRVVYTIRRDRAGAVQTKEQYAFIYKALNLYAAKLAGGALESM